MEGVRNVLKVSELNKSEKEWAYQVSLYGKYEVLRGEDVEGVEMEWKISKLLCRIVLMMHVA